MQRPEPLMLETSHHKPSSRSSRLHNAPHHQGAGPPSAGNLAQHATPHHTQLLSSLCCVDAALPRALEVSLTWHSVFFHAA